MNFVLGQVSSRKNLPPCSSIILLEMLRPNPVPLPIGFVVKNGCMILSAKAFGIPEPESEISSLAKFSR